MLGTGGTGQVGYHLMEELADAGAEATAMVRVAAKAADLPGSPQHVVASFDHPPAAEFHRAFDRVFLLSPAHEGQVELHTIFFDPLVLPGQHPQLPPILADVFHDLRCHLPLPPNDPA